MDLGDTLPFRSDVHDTAGALANAATVALTITLPDGTTVTPTVTSPPSVTGKYAYDYVTTLASPAGRYVGQWLFTFAGGATTSYVETFDVGPALITVDEALQHLRAAGVIESEPDLDYLQWLCIVATDAVERDLGRVFARRTVVETFNGGGGAIILTKTPVASVTSVSQSGYSFTDFVLDSPVLQRNYGGWSRGFQNIVVTYVAGYLNPPPIVRKVALNTVQGMWQESQQAFHPGLDEFQAGSVGTATAALTYVEQMAYNSLRSAGIA